MHCQVKCRLTNSSFFCSFIYAANDHYVRRDLWDELILHKYFVANNPWVLLGDFNVALDIDDTSTGSSGLPKCILEFKECVKKIEISDINCSGLKYTLNQKPQGSDGILKKLDRVMANALFISMYPNAHVIFQPYRVSDHSPRFKDSE